MAHQATMSLNSSIVQLQLCCCDTFTTPMVHSFSLSQLHSKLKMKLSTAAIKHRQPRSEFLFTACDDKVIKIWQIRHLRTGNGMKFSIVIEPLFAVTMKAADSNAQPQEAVAEINSDIIINNNNSNTDGPLQVALVSGFEIKSIMTTRKLKSSDNNEQQQQNQEQQVQQQLQKLSDYELVQVCEDGYIYTWNLAQVNSSKALEFNSNRTFKTTSSYLTKVIMWWNSHIQKQCLIEAHGRIGRNNSRDNYDKRNFVIVRTWTNDSEILDDDDENDNIITSEIVHKLVYHDNNSNTASAVTAMLLFDDTKGLLLTGNLSTLVLWNLFTGTVIKTFSAKPTGTIESICKISELVCSSSCEYYGINLWNIESGQCLQSIPNYLQDSWMTILPHVLYVPSEHCLMALRGSYDLKFWKLNDDSNIAYDTTNTSIKVNNKQVILHVQNPYNEQHSSVAVVTGELDYYNDEDDEEENKCEAIQKQYIVATDVDGNMYVYDVKGDEIIQKITKAHKCDIVSIAVI